MKKISNERLDRMIELAEVTGVSLDDIVAVMGRVDQKTFLKLSGNPETLPRYIKSKVI